MSSNLFGKQIVIQRHLINYYCRLPDSYVAALVFLHGWRSSASVWNGLIEQLDLNTYAVCSLDLPGFGLSESPHRPYDLKDYATIVEELIKKLNLKNVILIGHSFGGRIGVKLSANSSLIKSLILIGSAGIKEDTVEKKLKRSVAKIVKPFFRPDFMKALRARLYEHIGSEDYVAAPHLQQTFVKIIGEDLKRDMMKIKIPATIIWGENDKEAPVRWAHQMHKLIKDSKLFIIPNAAHYPFIDQPQEFISIFKKSLHELV